jgi:hypothetical protein
MADLMNRRTVSGRYRGEGDRFGVELRVDVDGPRPMRQVSADYYRVADRAPVGSMRVEAPQVATTASEVTITGRGDFTWQTAYRDVRIVIARVALDAPPAPATLRHSAAGDAYRCAYESQWLRTVELEEACQQGVTRFRSYDTGALASGGPGRTLSPVTAFAEAGIELRVSGEPATVDTARAGAEGAWSDAELHAAMEIYFSRWADRPEWAIWLMHATVHDSDALAGPNDARMQGIMFDRRGAQRQGCAVFYDAMPGSSSGNLRRQLHTCVHELAHGFNLLHCWQKSMARPPVPSRPAAASWMNYPDRFPGGTDAFWAAFAFAFDDLELAHLRHAFRDDVIMGGAPFLSNAALERTPDWDAEAGDPGLRLRLAAPRAIAYGIPVTLELELSATTREGRQVRTSLDPRSDSIDIAIRPPGGESVVFAPLINQCRGEQTAQLTSAGPPLRDTAFVHYGRDGYPFAEPGSYEVRARYTAPDGSFALSQIATIAVQRPRSAPERDLGALVYDDEQVGVLMAVMGSDAAALRRGTGVLHELVERVPEHPLASIARLVQGANAAREFKSVGSAGLSVRAPDGARARALVRPVIDLDRLRRASEDALAAGAGGEGVAAALTAVGARPGMASAVDAFIRSQRDELAAELPVLISTPFRRAPAPAADPLPGRATRTTVSVSGPTIRDGDESTTDRSQRPKSVT